MDDTDATREWRQVPETAPAQALFSGHCIQKIDLGGAMTMDMFCLMQARRERHAVLQPGVHRQKPDAVSAQCVGVRGKVRRPYDSLEKSSH